MTYEEKAKNMIANEAARKQRAALYGRLWSLDREIDKAEREGRVTDLALLLREHDEIEARLNPPCEPSWFKRFNAWLFS